MGCWNKFSLLMWKNWKLQSRRPIAFIVELAIPTLIIALFLVIRHYTGKHIQPEEMYHPKIINGWNSEYFVMGYSPHDNKLINEMMSSFPNAEPFENAKKLEDYLIKASNSSKNDVVGIQFDQHMPQEISQNISIILRFASKFATWNTDQLYPPYETPFSDRNPNRDVGGPPDYAHDFIPLMYSLTSLLLQKSGHDGSLPKMFLQRFPHPSYVRDNYLEGLSQGSIFAFFLTTAFIYGCMNLAKSITYEKEKQLKESMKIMGLPTWLHWTAWYCKMMIPFSIIAVFLVIIVKWETRNGALLEKSDAIIILIFFMIFLSALITFCFALSVFFSKANRAASMAGILWFLSLLPYLIIRNGNYYRSGKNIKYFTSLSVTSAMSYGFDIILERECSNQGVTWANLFETSGQLHISFGGIILMMILDLVLYLLIALYVEALFPGEFGVPQKWYFFATRKFWCMDKQDQDEYLLDQNNSEYFEDDPVDLRPGITMQNLKKSFGANEAVGGISLSLYEDQITVLLGHNGAGKTTTMSMLTGMFPPTKGTAIINGYDIRTQMMNVRDSMGICFQHNILFDELTVREHLIFFSRLKGCTGSDVKEEVDKFLKLLNLEDKSNDKSSNLSGGMKRKLCVGIALCGNSKIIMLDEPTAGMDPSARRFIWEFLQKQKIGRTILLTTHFMDEADLLGDRIAIMSGGKLQCCGSSFFLKKKYGTGYHLIIDQTPTCNPNNITNVIRKYIPNIEIESNAGTELSYLLPENYSSKFSHLLSDLENNLQELGIRSFGISLTDLEEVFMKVGATETGRLLQKTRENPNSNVNNHTANLQISISEMVHGADLYINQCLAIFWKKMLTTKRSWVTELLKIVLPVLYIILIIKSTESSIEDSSYNMRSFDLDQYQEPITLVQNGTGSQVVSYSNMLHKMKKKVEFTSDMSQTILNLKNNSPSLVRFRYIVGASFEESASYAWFNNDPFHSVPLSVQLVLQNWYKQTLGPDFNINFINYPLPENKSEEQKVGMAYAVGNVHIISLSLAISYIGSFYILFNIKEKMSQAKHLQFVSGINVFIFRFVSFICDFLTFLVPAIVILITFAVLRPSGLSTGEDIARLAFLLLSFGVAVIPWIYIFSFFFTIPSTGYSRMFILSFITGFPAVIILKLLIAVKWKYASAVRSVLMCFPHFDFVEGVSILVNRHFCQDQMELCLKHATKKDCETLLCSNGCCDNIFGFGENGLGLNILVLFAMAYVCFFILFLIDYKIIANLFYMAMQKIRRPPNVLEYVDEDVKIEDDLVHTRPLHELQSEYALIIKDLTKHFCRLTAVNGLNLAVKKSECFGLLGVNGAGKTTTFRMLTGDEMISYGDGWINNYSIKNEMKKVQKFIGYCPQFDALLDDLTARETLKIFSLIRGTPRDECNYSAERLAREFDFFEHLDKQVKQLSGGNKRKLSTAISLIGDAPIIFLDEPTTGMDPATKRHLWNNLTKIRESGKSIILTSHSMEECEALCTRLAIMVNGNFQCLGSTQHLKSKYAEGYSITLKVRKPDNSRGLEHTDTAAIENFVIQNFPTAELREKHQELLTYYIKDHSLSWSKLFGILEQAKVHLDLEDYSVGQASLEQVFLTFTKNQLADGDVVVKRGCKAWCC